MQKLYKKIYALQAEILPIVRDTENDYYKSKYFDINKVLETLKPLLAKEALMVVQPLVIINGRNAIETRIIDTESFEEIVGQVYLPENVKPQELGSAVTYFRRYSLQSMLCLQAEDDDGNAASNSKPAYPKTAAQVTTSRTKVIQNPANDLPFE